MELPNDWSPEQEDFHPVDVDEEQPLMAHTGQIDGLPPDVSEEQDLETSNRQEANMMKGLINLSLIHISEPTRLDVI
eukprot:7366924-Prorocentrum_lima.AAC.1